MRVKTKVFLLLTLLLAVIVSGFGWRFYLFVQDEVTQRAYRELSLILEFDLAIREYMGKTVRPKIAEFMPEDRFDPALMSTSFTSRSICDTIKSRRPEYLIKFSATNPRNPSNMAGAEEKKMIDYFNDHPEKKYWSGEMLLNKTPHHAVFFARRMESSCLRCHGDPQDAPRDLLQLYGDTAGFHIPLGAVIGLDTIAVPKTYVESASQQYFRRTLPFVVAGILLFAVAVFLVVKLIVTDRLERVSRHFYKNIEQEGTLHLAPVVDAKNDEIGQLTAAYNLLVEEVNRQQGELEESNRLMEEEIAQRKETEEQLRQREERLRIVNDNSPDIILSLDGDGRFTYVSRVVTLLLGFTPEELFGKTFVTIVHNAHVANSMKMVRNGILRRGKTIRDLSVDLVAKDGTTKKFSISGAPLHDAAGTISGLVGVCKDITRHKNLERQVQQFQKFEAIGSLAGGLAHDFNNLLMGISGNLSLLEMQLDKKDGNQEDFITSIKKCVQDGAALTAQLLGFARSGKYEVTVFNPNRTVEKTLSLFSRTNRGIQVMTDLDENLANIEADESQITQVLLNLFVNAGQAMPGGGLLSVSTTNVTYDVCRGDDIPPGAVSGRYVKLSITDNGVGISRENTNKIFDPFYTTKEKGKGTGLGLASAHGIVKNHGGIITVYSEKGNGTTFNIYLPVTEKNTCLLPNMEEPLCGGSEHILLIDDEEMVLQSGAKMLSHLGYTVSAAQSGKAALDILQDDSIAVDMIVMDLVMPGLSGMDLFQSILAARPNIRTLIASGFSINGQANSLLAAGCQGFLQKPFDMATFARKIRTILDEEEQ